MSDLDVDKLIAERDSLITKIENMHAQFRAKDAQVYRWLYTQGYWGGVIAEAYAATFMMSEERR